MQPAILIWELHRSSPPQIAPLYKMLLLCVENYSFQLNPSLHVFRYHLCASNEVHIRNNLKGSIQHTLVPASISANVGVFIVNSKCTCNLKTWGQKPLKVPEMWPGVQVTTDHVYLVSRRLEVLRLFLGCVRREWDRRPWLLRLRLFSITLLAWERKIPC